MAVYRYTAKRLDGGYVRGRMQAADEEQAYGHLKSSGLYLVRIRELKVRAYDRPLPIKLLGDFSKELSVMLGAGIPLVQSLNMLSQRELSPAMAAVYQNLYLSIAAGNHLSKALKDAKGVFPSLMIQMVKAGEESGKLSEAIARLAEYYDKDDRLRKQIVSATVYPIFLFFLTVAAVIIIFTVVMPHFFELFETLETLPFTTRCLIWISQALRQHSIAVLVATLGFLLFLIYLWNRSDTGKAADHMIFKIPVAGKLLCTIVTSRFARTLTSLYTSGVALPQALHIAADVIGNRYLKAQLETAIEDVCNGVSLSSALSMVDGFDNRLVTGIYIGEESGELDTMLDHIAESFDFSAREASKQLTALVEPVMIVILALIIGCIMLSVMLPIYQYYQSLS